MPYFTELPHLTSPLNDLLMLPELASYTIDVPQRQQNWRLGAFIHSLGASSLGHVCADEARTAAVDKHSVTMFLMLPRNRSCYADDTAFADCVCCAGPSLLLLITLLDRCCKCVHQFGDLIDSSRSREGC